VSYLDTFGLSDSTTGSAVFSGKWVISLLGYLVYATAWSMVAVAIHRLILFRDRRPGTYALFSLGRAEAYFLLTWVIAFVAAAVCAFIILVPAVQVAIRSDEASPPVWIVPCIIFAILAAVYLFVRLMLIYPIIVAEQRFDVGQSWRLSRGNFWRLYGVFLFGTLPLLALTGLVLFMVAQFALDFSSAQAFVESAERARPYTITLNFVLALLNVAVGVALLCYSYKDLKGLSYDAVLPREAG
jgi:hypothetical protein